MKKMPFVFAVACLLCAFRPAWALPEATQALFRAILWGTPEEVQAAIDAGADLHAVTPTWRYRYGAPMEGELWTGVEREAGEAEEDDGTDLPLSWSNWLHLSGGEGDVPWDLRRGGGESALMMAVRAVVNGWQPIGVVEKLLDAGCDVNQRDALGRTALLIASEVDPYECSFPEDAELERAFADVVGLLVRRGASVDAADERGETALMNVITVSNKTSFIPALLAAGADVNARDARGRSAVMRVLRESWWNMKDILPLLLDAASGCRGVRPESLRDAGTTALKLAMNCEPAVAEQLLKWDWTREELNEALLTPSTHSGMNVDVVELLVRRGADINARTPEGRNALLESLARTPYHENHTFAEKVSRMAEMGLDVAARANDGSTALMVPEPPHLGGYDTCTRLLLDAGVDPRAKDDRGRTCLHAPRSAAPLRLLLETGAESDTPDEDERTPLFFMNDYESMNLLVSHGARVNVADRNGATPLLAAIRENRAFAGRTDRVGLLLDAGADVNAADREGVTPLMAVSVYPDRGEEDCSVWIVPLLKKGADPDAKRFDGATALSLIVRQTPPAYRALRGEWISEPEPDIFEWRKAAVDALLAYGADPDEPDLSGKSARDYAREQENPRLEELFADVRPWHEVPLSRTPLMAAALESADTTVLEGLLTRGESLASRDRYGWTPLMFAAWSNPNPGVVKFLIGRGSDPNARDALGKTPLMLAAWHNTSLEVLRELVRSGADASLCDFAGNNVLDAALAGSASSGILEFLYDSIPERFDKGLICRTILLSASDTVLNPKTLQMLLKKGVMVDCRDADGQTPLMKAVANGHTEIARALLDAKADPNARDGRGLSVLDYALKGDPEVLRLLIEAGVDLEADSVYWAAWEKMLLTPKGGR